MPVKLSWPLPQFIPGKSNRSLSLSKPGRWSRPLSQSSPGKLIFSLSQSWSGLTGAPPESVLAWKCTLAQCRPGIWTSAINVISSLFIHFSVDVKISENEFENSAFYKLLTECTLESLSGALDLLTFKRVNIHARSTRGHMAGSTYLHYVIHVYLASCDIYVRRYLVR